MGKKLSKGQRKNLRKQALRRLLWAGARVRKKPEAEKVECGAGAETLLRGDLGDETPQPAGVGQVEAPATPEPVAEVVVKVEAPATPPLFSEPHETVPWPEAGVKVAVGVEDLSHCLRLGETGVSEGPAPDAPSEVIVKLDATAVLAPMRIPRSLLVPRGPKMSNMRLWDKCSDRTKRDLLLKVGVSDPRDEVLPSSASLSLTMWGEYVPIGLGLDEERQFKFVQPAFVKALEDGANKLDKYENDYENDEIDCALADLEDLADRQDARELLLENWWAKHELLLVCFCDEASGSSALLAVRKTPVSVRFYEVVTGRLESGRGVGYNSVQEDWIGKSHILAQIHVGWSLQVDVNFQSNLPAQTYKQPPSPNLFFL